LDLGCHRQKDCGVESFDYDVYGGVTYDLYAHFKLDLICSMFKVLPLEFASKGLLSGCSKVEFGCLMNCLIGHKMWFLDQRS